jgi:hypothetical protein
MKQFIKIFIFYPKKFVYVPERNYHLKKLPPYERYRYTSKEEQNPVFLITELTVKCCVTFLITTDLKKEANLSRLGLL